MIRRITKEILGNSDNAKLIKIIDHFDERLMDILSQIEMVHSEFYAINEKLGIKKDE
jgi:hypothetical protein